MDEKKNSRKPRFAIRAAAIMALALGSLTAVIAVAAPAQAYKCAQGPAYWHDKTGALACFKPNGDIWQAKDTKSDGDSAISWVVPNGSSGGWQLINSGGNGTWAAQNIYNLPEGGSYWLIACTQDFSEGGNAFCSRSAYTFSNNNALSADRDLGGGVSV